MNMHNLQELQDRALKVTKATEQLVASGHFAAEQATAQAYSVLNLSTEYLDAIEQREALLCRAVVFFRSAHTVSRNARVVLESNVELLL
jgi:hypothetical protein